MGRVCLSIYLGNLFKREISPEFHHDFFFFLLKSLGEATSKGWHEQRLLNFTLVNIRLSAVK